MALAGILLGSAALAAGCVHQPVLPTGTFDGTWSSAQLPYDIELNGSLGRAVHVRGQEAEGRGLRDGDPILRLISEEGSRFTARQWMPDGTWRTVTGELKQDGTLSCGDGQKSWTLERRK
ncbi:MAG: hypothetical protein AB1411_06790 [Nitrospirota bacterium]